MFTKSEAVTGTVYIWALPCTRYEMEEDPNRFPFKYELHTNTPWQAGAVRVSEHTVTLTTPAGINLLTAALETLEAKKKEAFDYYARQVAELDKEIKQLMLLSGPAHSSQVGGDFIDSTSEVESEAEGWDGVK